jgi:methylthioribose-1-phosphate isomerase
LKLVYVLVVTDSQIALHIPKCDMIFLGADRILKNGDVVNKSGSNNACIIAKYYGKSVIVLSSKNKFSLQKNFQQEVENSDEIWKYKHKKLQMENCYFEVVPKKLITKIITE